MNRIEIQPDGTGTVTLASGAETTRETIHAATWAEAQNAAVERLLKHAQQLGTTIEAVTSDPQAPRIRFSPDGTVVTLDEDTASLEDHDTTAAPTPAGTAAAPETPSPLKQELLKQELLEQDAASGENGRSPVDEAPADPVDDTDDTSDHSNNTATPMTHSPKQPSTRQPAQSARQNPFATSAAAPTQSRRQRREQRESFLKTQRREQPATRGWRGAVASLGIRVSPSAEEREEREDQRLVSQHWPGVRTIAVVNGKGGASKTPTTALLSAVFARLSGAPTVAWDNNETRGTLGWRTEQGPHEGTVLDLLPQAETLLAPQARAGDVGHYVHHQGADKYDVLRSNPHLLSAEQRLTGDDVDTIHDVMARYYRMIFVDSGNDESAGHWMRMVDKADAIVVATIAKPEHAEAGALLLEALAQRDAHSAQLARQATVIVSQAREKDANPSAAHIAGGFREWVRRVVTIPYDRAMVENVLHYNALAPATRRAWLHAAAAIAEGL